MKPTAKQSSIIWLETAESTNSELRKRIPGADNLLAVAAKVQTKGRGQGSHSWYSGHGTNLTFSIYYDFGGLPGQGLPAADALLVTEVTTLGIRDYLLSEGIEARIKWPNDIWAGEKKICGILIENTLGAGLIRHSIAGIGLNLNESSWPADLPNPVSVHELTGKLYDIRTELERLHSAIAGRFSILGSGKEKELLDGEFRKHLFHLGEAPHGQT